MFVKVAELGSLTRAADTLDTPQSVLSRQIGTLERECGSRLFRRTGRGVMLTDAGTRIFPRIKSLIAQADRLADDIRTSGNEPVGDVRLGLVPCAVHMVTASLYREAAKRYPKVKLHLTEGSTSQLELWLREGQLDLSLLLREHEIERPEEPTLHRSSLRLLGRCGDPVSSQPTVRFDELAELPLILPGRANLLRARLDAMAAERKISLTIPIQADSIGLQEQIVAAGGGYAIVTASAARTVFSSQFSVASIVDPELPHRVVLGSCLLRETTLATRAISRLLLEISPQVFS